jgi:hypothetical protein
VSPDVSVVIPAYNAMPYLVRCLESVASQTLGADRMEVIVVDDGSSDGTAAELDAWATRHPSLFNVLHQPGSGGPATPRNSALDLARGRFVYFLDADDYLGDEALERMLQAADRYGSDIVLGRMKGDGGRDVPESMFKENQPDADLFESRVFWTLAPLKLFRRDLIEEHGLRFPTQFPVGSDQPFTALAYLRAKRITVLADYDYYYAVRRHDDQHVTTSGTASNRLDVVEWVCELLSREVPEPGRRAPLLVRQFQIDLRLLMWGLVDRPREEQLAVLTRVGALVREHLLPEVGSALTPGLRVILDLAERGLLDEAIQVIAFDESDTPYGITVDGDRVFARLPFLRDSVVHVPDELYDVTHRIRTQHSLTSFEWSGGSLRITGVARFKNVSAVPQVEVVLRSRRHPTQEYAVPAVSAENGFEAHLDPLTVAGGGPLRGGLWEFHLRISYQGLTRTPRLGNGSDDLVTDPALTLVAIGPGTPWEATAFLTETGRLRLRLSRKSTTLDTAFGSLDASWTGDADLLVSGTAALRVDAPLAMSVGNGAGAMWMYPVQTSGGRLSARVPFADLPAGRWGVHLRVGVASRQLRVAIPHQPHLGGVRWRRSLRRMSAAPVTPARTLTLLVEMRGVLGAARRMLRWRR